MTQAAAMTPTTRDQVIDHPLRQIEAAWVAEEFAAIIAANWPTEPLGPPSASGPTHPGPPRPRFLARLQPRSRLTDPRARLRVCARQRAPPPRESSQVATPLSHATPDPDRAGWSGEARKT